MCIIMAKPEIINQWSDVFRAGCVVAYGACTVKNKRDSRDSEVGCETSATWLLSARPSIGLSAGLGRESPVAILSR